jgi:peptidoglycan/xylan/chitin deacetylase (PgdA/CDA1 family)
MRRIRAKSVLIVAHHGVTSDRLHVTNGCQVNAVEFERQMDHLAGHYRVLPLDEVAGRLHAGRSLPPNTACVTFDDGFRNVATTALPILKERQIPATVFIVTAFVDARQPAWPDLVYHWVAESPLQALRFEGVDFALATDADRVRTYRALSTMLKPLQRAERETRLDRLGVLLGAPTVPVNHPLATMSWAEAEELEATGLVRIGSHTHTHPILSRCSLDEQRRELEVSRNTLLEHGFAADLFAYPNGTAADFTAATRALVRETGYRCAVAMLPGLNRRGEDLFALRRIGVGADTTLREFRQRTAGL